MLRTELDTGWEFFKGTLEGAAAAWGTDLPWKPVRLPHCYNAYDAVDPDRRYYRGEAWYRTRIGRIATTGAERTLLAFDGGGPRIDVYVGNEHAGGWYGAGEARYLDITDACARYTDGTVDLQGVPVAVRCDNRRDRAVLPTERYGVCVSGGLFRSVALVQVPDVSVRALHVRTAQGADGAVTVTVRAALRNPGNRSASLTLDCAVTAPDGKPCRKERVRLDAWSGDGDVCSFDIEDPVFWSPSAPSLYACAVTLTGPGGKSTHAVRFGLRFAEFVPHGPFLLNGEPVQLRGVHYYPEGAGTGPALAAQDADAYLRLAKECGANLVRFAGCVPSDAMLDRCDELGLFAWAELPWDGTGADDAGLRESAQHCLAMMVEQHRNRPSVLAWGVCAGADGLRTNADSALLRELNDRIAVLDPDRPTAALHAPGAAGTTGLRAPRILRDGDDPHTFKGRVKDELHRDGPVLVADPCPEAVAGFHDDLPAGCMSDDVAGRPTETGFCNHLEHQLNILEHLPELPGYFAADLNDHAVPLRPDAAVPNVRTSGIITRDGERKAGFYALRSFWCARPFVHIAGHGAEVRAGRPDGTSGVRVYSNCASVELFLNNESLGVKERNPGDFPAAGLRWDVRFRKGKNVLRAVATVDGKEVHDTLECEYQTERWSKPRKFRLKVKRFRHGRRRVIARALDQRGIFCPDAELTVRFTVAGTGALLDNRGTVEGSKKVLMRNGVAAVWAVGNHGFSTVAVTGEGMRTVFKRMR